MVIFHLRRLNISPATHTTSASSRIACHPHHIRTTHPKLKAAGKRTSLRPAEQHSATNIYRRSTGKRILRWPIMGDAKWEVKNGRLLANDFGSPRKTKKADTDAAADEALAAPADNAAPAVYMP
jgi:hypothetical protein